MRILKKKYYFSDRTFNLQKENADLEALVSILEDDTIISFKGSRYTNDVNLQKENADLEALVSILEDDTIISFKGSHYTNDVREVIMELLSRNISMNKVNEVIKVVLRWKPPLNSLKN